VHMVEERSFLANFGMFFHLVAAGILESFLVCCCTNCAMFFLQSGTQLLLELFLLLPTALPRRNNISNVAARLPFGFSDPVNLEYWSTNQPSD